MNWPRQSLSREKKEEDHFHQQITLAFGLSVDLSEDNDPQEELGDKQGWLNAESAHACSAEPPSCIGGSIGLEAAGNLPSTGESEGSVIIFPWLQDEGSDKVALKDNPSDSVDRCLSATCRMFIRRQRSNSERWSKTHNLANRVQIKYFLSGINLY